MKPICLIELYNEEQGYIVKLYIHNLYKQMNIPSPYNVEFKKPISLFDARAFEKNL